MTVITHKMRAFGLVLGTSACLFIYPGGSRAEFDRGEALYQNHCQECHESWAHTREGRHANTIDGLRRRVAAWSFHSGLDWSDDEINDVADLDTLSGLFSKNLCIGQYFS